MLDPNADLAQLFLKYDYAETKDLAKSFLTLNSAILVFSVAFSEKVVEFRTARLGAKIALIGSWALSVTAIAMCGLAVCFISIAGGYAVYGGDFQSEAMRAYNLLVASGSLFVLALVLLVLSAVMSVLGRTADTANAGNH